LAKKGKPVAKQLFKLMALIAILICAPAGTPRIGLGAQGRALGGDQLARWRCADGIAGFYAGVNPQAAEAHLNMALRLGPFDHEARDFLGRLDARRKVAQGIVTSQMGQSPDAPIEVRVMAQEDEFMALFQVQPLSPRRLGARPVDVWQCRDQQGAPVTYYFDHSAVHAIAFD
jgi:hypothetical protein